MKSSPTIFSSWTRIRRACFRRKTVSQAIAATTTSPHEPGSSGGGVGLCRSLTAIDLILYGVGSSVGAGIYVLVGLGAKIAGPAISLSFLACGCACILTSFCYAEFASRIPVTGSAFVYAYVSFGEVWAWLVGWNLTLGYGFTASVVARAWGDYLGDFIRQSLRSMGAASGWLQQATELLSAFPLLGQDMDYRCSPLSMIIVYATTLVLLRGVKDSSRFNNAMTILNISILVLVILSGIFSQSVQVGNLLPFVPHGISGVVGGAGLVFFAFIGFDMVASLSEEVVHPEKNMPIGIVGSLVISTLLYVTVALVVVAMAPISVLGETVPIVNALQANSCCSNDEIQELTAKQYCINASCYPAFRPWLGKIAGMVSVGAVLGLIASVFTSLMGQPRILFSLARDGLIHPVFAQVDPLTQVPRTGIILTGILTAVLACFAPMAALANLISLGTLFVFTFVDVGVLFLRLRETAQKTSDNPLHHHRSEYQHTVGMLILVYTTSTLVSAALLSHTTWTVTSYALGGFSVLVAGWITLLPPTWQPSTALHHHHHYLVGSDPDSTRNHEHGYFASPGVPILPLLGIACNTFMMGSLPLSSWVLCLVWIAIGVAVYFLYGIHHSTLGHLEDFEGLRLVSIVEEAVDGRHKPAVYHSTPTADATAAAITTPPPPTTTPARFHVGEQASLLSNPVF